MSLDGLSDRWAKALGSDLKQFNMFFEKMMVGFAYHKIVQDREGKPIDYVFLEVNEAFEKLTGLKKERILGKNVTQVLKGIENDPADWIAIYGKVALTCESAQFENFSEQLGRWFNVYVYCPKRGYFVTLFEDITNRKKAEQALKESEARFRSAMDNMLEGCQIIGHDWRYIYINDAAERHNRRPKEELLGKRYMDMWPEIESTKVFAAIKRCMEGRTHESMENEFTFPDGTKGWFDLRFEPMTEGIFILSIDISERKKAEDALKEGEQRYRQLFTSITGMFTAVNLNYFVADLVHDKDGKVVDLIYRDVSPATERLMGKSADQVVGRSRKEVFGEINDEFPERFDRVIQTGEPVHFETYGAGLDKYYDVYAWRAPGNHVAALVSDITDRRRAEEALRQSEERFYKAFNSSPVAVVITRYADGCYVDVNETFLSYFEYSPDEVLGHTSTELKIFASPDGRKEFLRLLNESQGRLRDCEMTFRGKTGKLVDTIISSEKICFDGQDHLLTVMMDITPRKNAEKALKTTLERFYNSLSSMHSAILLVSSEGLVEFANQAFCEYFGIEESPSELRGLSSEEILEKIKSSYDNPAKELARIGAIVDEGKAVICEEVALTGGRTCLRDFIPLSGDGGSFSRLWQHTDITERKKAELAIEESEARFRLALNHAPVSVAAQDCNLRYIWAYNQKTASQGEIIGKFDEDIFTADEASHLTAIKQRVIREDSEYHEQMWLNRASGRICLEVFFEPIHDKDGQVIGVGTATVDLTKIKLAEEALNESAEREHFLAELIRNASVAVGVGYPDGTLGTVNPAFEDLTGYSQEELKKISWNTVLTPPEYWEMEKEKLAELQRTRQHVRYEKEYIRKDGSRVPIELVVHPSFDDNGNVTHYFSFITDITERKMMSEALRSSEQRWATTLASIGDAVIATDVYGDITFMNKTAEELTGWTLGEASQNPVRKIFNIINATTRMEVEDPVAKVLAKGMVVGLANHTILVRKDGAEVAIDDSGAPIRDSEGNITGVVLVFRDITEQKKAQEALRASEEKYRHLLQYAPTAIYEVDFTGPRFITVNDGVAQMSGYSKEELLAKSPFDFMEAESVERFKERIRKASAGEKIDENVEYKAIHKDGHLIYVTLNVRLLSKAGKVYGAQVVAHDVTEHRKAEEEILKAKEQTELDKKRLEIILETVPSAVIIVDANRKLSYLNKRAIAIYGIDYTGYDLETHVARIKALNPDNVPYRPDEMPSSRSLALGQEVRNEEITIERADGTRLPILVSSVPLYDNKGKITAAIVIFDDISKRKQTEDALRNSEVWKATSFYTRNLIEASLDPMVTISAEGKITDVNKATEFITGCSRGELIGTDFSNYFTEPEKAKAGYKHVFTEGFVKDYPLAIRNKSGKVADVLYHASVYRDEKGEIQGVFAAARDITERKQAEDALQAERKRLYGVLEALPAMICLLTPDYHVAFANRSFREKFGESKGRHCYDYCFGNREPCGFCESYTVLKTGKPHHWEVKGSDGSVISAYDFPFIDADGSPLILEMDMDITEQKRAEAMVSEQARLLDRANDAIFVRDLDDRIIYWNEGAERLYGWKREEAVGKNVHELLHNDPALIDDAASKAMTSGQWSGELKHSTKDDKAIVVDSRWTLVSDQNQKPVSIMEINTDITEKKNLEAQYLRAQRLESLGTLAGGIAHDFRNILTPVTIALGLMDQHLTTKEDHDMVAMLQKNLQRGTDLAKQLLTFTKGTEGDRVAISVPTLISEVEMTIKETFPRSIRIETKVEPNLPALMGDPTKLHQVLINMCINARDAMPFGGTLSIASGNAIIDKYYADQHPEAKAGSYVLLSVTDNGVGMPPEVMERLFEPFFTTKKPGEGTGLGLSTARSIVRSHGGFINVYSEVGEGTTFKIYLPTGDAKIDPQEKYKAQALLQGSGQTILLVDDEESIRIATSAVLKNNGYKVLEAGDGAEALAVYIKHNGDISAVLVDMAMPIMDGEATIRALKKLDPKLRIIGMSGLAENGRYSAMYNVTNDFMTKPFTAEKLLGALAKVMSK